MPATFDINQDELIKFTKKLSKLHKSALPLAIRGTLNDVAVIACRESLKKFKNNFDVKPFAKKFAPAHIVFQKSPDTFDVNKMVSAVGIPAHKSKAGDSLANQETGSKIENRDIPTNDVRISGNAHSPINRAMYIRLFKKRPQGLVYKSGESHIIKTGDRILRVSKGSKWKTLYILNRTFRLEKKPFISFGAKKASKQIERLYYKRANERIKKEMKKFMK